MLLLHRVGVFAGALLISLPFTPPLYAQCTLNGTTNQMAHFLVNGRWKDQPEVIFKVPGASVGNGIAVSPDSVINDGNGNTLPKHLRFRLRVHRRSSTGVRMYMDSGLPLSCTTCASAVNVPFSKISWTEGTATETTGITPGNGQFNDGVQSLIYAGSNTNNIFNLQFNFANDTVLPAGVYTGEFLTRGVPQ